MTIGRSGSPLLQPNGFVWAAGIEDTIIGQPLRDGGGILDEYALTQHDRFWREDLDRAASLGISAIRYGVPWHRVNPAPGEFDWRCIDEILTYAVQTRGLMVIADLVHYGAPLWLEDAFVDPVFPRAMADYAGAFARRYAPLVHHYTPLNEPLITASFCGERGVWPPYLDGNAGWSRVILGIVAGIKATIPAIRSADPEAVIVHVEAAKLLRSTSSAPRDRLEIERARAFLATDLLLNRVDDFHPLAGWLREAGVKEGDLRRLQSEPAEIDVIGVNYYPDLSVRELVEHEGRLREVTVEGWDHGLVEVIDAFWQRYDLPIFVSETSTEGDDERRADWLEASTAALTRLHARGVPVRGYTWWPLFDFVDWSYASGGRTVEEFWTRTDTPDGGDAIAPVEPPGGPGDDIDVFLRRMGLWRLASRPDGTLDRLETSVVDRMRTLSAHAVDDVPR